MAANPHQQFCGYAVGQYSLFHLRQFLGCIDLVCNIVSKLRTSHKVTAFTTPCQFLAAAFGLIFKG